MTLVLWICEIQIVHETEEKFDCFRKCDDIADNKLVFNCDVDLWRFVWLAYHHSVGLRIISDILFQRRFLHNKDSGDTYVKLSKFIVSIASYEKTARFQYNTNKIKYNT